MQTVLTNYHTLTAKNKKIQIIRPANTLLSHRPIVWTQTTMSCSGADVTGIPGLPNETMFVSNVRLFPRHFNEK